MVRFGYFVPEFPGQTHTFFWRELAALRNLGLDPELVSTRRPPQAIVSHSWANEAMAATRYLVPPGPSTLLQMPSVLLQGVRNRGRGGAYGHRPRTPGALGAWYAVRQAALAGVGAELAVLARQREWTHVHVHSCADAALVAMHARRLTGVPYSLTLHGPLSDYGPRQREKWRHAAFGITITKALAAEVAIALDGDLPPVIDVAPMGVDLSNFSRRRPYRPWAGTGEVRVFACGRLNPSKGHLDLIAAARLLVDEGLDMRLTIAGEDEQGGIGYRRELESGIGRAGMRDRVTLLGSVSEEDIRDALETSHVFALASEAEPLGVAIMEAMAMGLPVVVTGAGGVPELVEDGVHGRLVSPRHPEELASALAEVLGEPSKALHMGAAGRRRIEESFDSGRSARVLAARILD
ncbi:exopolysaccharide biosynthesis GT4 family glycosyltransferase EpsE [Arthrobacter sp. NPDC089319]|uniref:exopolysaccharide biosynthesis GT4 family glycosyltransferase EpsE n=1 Tax=Arthrobacter sp. NPDC089319 TaxID=3155915 RepID=UPI00342BF4A2